MRNSSPDTSVPTNYLEALQALDHANTALALARHALQNLTPIEPRTPAMEAALKFMADPETLTSAEKALALRLKLNLPLLECRKALALKTDDFLEAQKYLVSGNYRQCLIC